MAKRLTRAVPVVPTAPANRRRRVKGGDPNYHYRWTHPNKVQDRREDYGYEIVRQGEEGEVENPYSLSGAVTSGGDVLMRCPRDEYEARKKYRDQIAAESVKGPSEAFKTTGAQHGVATIDISSQRQGTMKSVLGERDPSLRDINQ